MASNSNDLFILYEMKEGGGAIYALDYWCLKCLWYNVNHIDIIQEFVELYIVRV
jgi:hypothetical protein